MCLEHMMIQYYEILPILEILKKPSEEFGYHNLNYLGKVTSEGMFNVCLATHILLIEFEVCHHSP